MTEETALELLSELQLVNDNMELIMDALNPIIFSAAIIAGIICMFFGAYIISLLIAHAKGR